MNLCKLIGFLPRLQNGRIMKISILFIMCFLFLASPVFAQSDGEPSTSSKLVLYKNHIRAGDAAYAEKNYSEASAEYKKALEIMPGDRYATYKQEDANTMQQIKQEDEDYLQAIQSGDTFFEQMEYQQAKVSFEKALKIRPDEKYPKRKIKEIEDLLANSDKLKKLQDKTDKAYQDLINQADVTFNKAFYEASKGFYQKALEVKPNESYPRKQIAEIDRLISEKALAQAKERALNETYRKLIEQADQKFYARSFDHSKSLYEEALSVKPNEQYPKDQLLKIESALAESKVEAPVLVMKEEPKAEPAVQIQDKKTEKLSPPTESGRIENPSQFEKLVQKQKTSVAVKESDNTSVKESLVKAGPAPVIEDQPISEKSVVSPSVSDNQLPKVSEKNIETKPEPTIIVEQKSESTESNHETRLQARSPRKDPPPAPKDPVLAFSSKDQSLIIENEKKYLLFIAKGDELFTQRSYQESRANFVNANKIKPSEQYPILKISEIDGTLKGDAANLMDAMAEKDPYFIALKKADEALAEKELTVAAFYYKKASSIRGFEPYPKDQLNYVNQLKDILKQEKEDQQYAESVKKGDEFFAIQEFPSSRFYFRKAVGIKPDALYPKSRLQDIDEALRMLKKDNKESDFLSYKKKGIEALNAQDLPVAEFYLEKALYLKALDPEVNEYLDEIYRRKNNVADIEKIDQYQKAIKTADEHFEHKSYQSARYFYLKALEYRVNDDYARKQLEKIAN